MDKAGEKKLEGKVALVTGSSYGIGRGIAIELARQGAKVLVTGRRGAEIEKTVEMIREIGGQALGQTMDISQKKEIDRFFETFVEPEGIDIFCNNAGITVSGEFVNNTEEELESLCRTNLLGASYCIQHAARLMKRQGRGGNIVVITSCNAHAPLPGQAFYSALKCGLEGLVKALAYELREDHIRVNAVAPGAVYSGMIIGTEEELLEYGRTIPIPRIGEPEDIGKAVAFMVSEEASYITGTSLLVDGGLVLRAQ